MGYQARSGVSTAAALLAVFAGCGGESEPPPEYPPLDEPETTVTVEQVEDASPEQEPPAPPPIQVVAAERTPLEGAAPTLRIRAPRSGQLIRSGSVTLRVQLTGWGLEPAPGKHVHVILDNEPYIAVRDVSGAIDLNQLVQENLGHELAPGTHVLRLFPSRGHHESVKEGSSFATVVFHYGERTADFAFDPAAPLLTYSRPRGCMPFGERVLLDFYLSHVDELASDGFRVRYSIDGAISGDITTWAPHYIENLPVGDHSMQLQLIGADGNAVAGMFNDTRRTIQIAQACPPAAAPAPAPQEPAPPQ